MSTTPKKPPIKNPAHGVKVLITPALAASVGLKRKAPKTAFKPGQPKRGGRKKGTPNKVTADMKSAVMEAFQRLGGADFFVRVGKSKAAANKRAMVNLFGKMLPIEVDANVRGGIQVVIDESMKDA